MRKPRLYLGIDAVLRRAVLPTGFALLFYSLAIDRLRNPAIFSGAVTLIALPGVRSATRNGPGGKK